MKEREKGGGRCLHTHIHTHTPRDVSCCLCFRCGLTFYELAERSRDWWWMTAFASACICGSRWWHEEVRAPTERSGTIESDTTHAARTPATHDLTITGSE